MHHGVLGFEDAVCETSSLEPTFYRRCIVPITCLFYMRFGDSLVRRTLLCHTQPHQPILVRSLILLNQLPHA